MQQGGSGRIPSRWKEETNRFIRCLTGGGGFTAGGGGFAAGSGGCLGGLPHGRGKAGDTFLLDKTGFNLTTETLSCLESICSLKYLSFLSTTLYGPQYS